MSQPYGPQMAQTVLVPKVPTNVILSTNQHSVLSESLDQREWQGQASLPVVLNLTV